MREQIDYTKIKTFERLFRSLKHGQDEEKQKDPSQEAFCSDVQKILEEIEQARMRDCQSETKATADQYIVLCGPIGMGGTTLMAKYFHEELRSVFPAWMFRDALEMEAQLHLYPAKEMLEKYNVSAAYPVGEGGLRRTLYQLGKDTGIGYEIQARRVPVNQITIEFCEHFDLDPWSLFSGGCTLLVCPKPAGLLEELSKQKIQAEVIGTMAANKDKVITYGTTRSLVNRPKADALLTIW